MKGPKKSETLEVRLPHEMKQSFMQRCRATGASASDVVREAIERYLEGPASPQSGAVPMPSYRFALISTGLLIAGAAVAGLLAVQPSVAQPDLQSRFAALDANHDGAVSQAEMSAAHSDDRVFVIHRQGHHLHGGATFTIPLTPSDPGAAPAVPASARTPTTEERTRLTARQFALTDGDGDGRITLEEFTARHRAIANQGFVAMDANGDGRITQREFQAMFGPGEAPPALGNHWSRLDADRDGAVTPEEFAGGHRRDAR